MIEERDRREPSLLPAIDQALCNGCGICIARCPTAALLEPMNASCSKCVKYCTTMEVPCCPTRLVLVDGLCNGCGMCATVCPLHAIAMTAESNVPKSAAAG